MKTLKQIKSEVTSNDVLNSVQLAYKMGGTATLFVDGERVKLTTANCHRAAEVRDIKHPEWGDWKFNYNAQALPNGRYAHTVGVGCNSKVVSVNELSDYEVVRWDSKTIISN